MDGVWEDALLPIWAHIFRFPQFTCAPLHASIHSISNPFLPQRLTHLCATCWLCPFLGHFTTTVAVRAHFAAILRTAVALSWKTVVEFLKMLQILLLGLVPLLLPQAHAGMVNVCSDVKDCAGCTNSYVNIFAFREYCRFVPNILQQLEVPLSKAYGYLRLI